jgi:ribonucrease Y
VGKLRYRTSYGQNVLNHSVEVAELTGSMAAELGLDVQLARRAGLLHDLGKAIDFEREGTHPELGGQAARAAGEHEVVVNAIESHHEDVEVIHPISILVAVADSISGGRLGARRASLADYAKRIETLESIVNSFEGVEQAFAIQAGREVRVIVKADRVTDARMPFLANEMTKKIQEEMDYPGRVKVTMIREMKAVEYAG